MRNLTETRWEAFITIMRRYAKLKADLGLFLGMVVRSELDQQPIQDWRGSLEKLRKLPGYTAQLEEIERLISQVDALTPDTDLNRLNFKNSTPRLPELSVRR